MSSVWSWTTAVARVSARSGRLAADRGFPLATHSITSARSTNTVGAHRCLTAGAQARYSHQSVCPHATASRASADAGCGSPTSRVPRCGALPTSSGAGATRSASTLTAAPGAGTHGVRRQRAACQSAHSQASRCGCGCCGLPADADGCCAQVHNGKGGSTCAPGTSEVLTSVIGTGMRPTPAVLAAAARSPGVGAGGMTGLGVDPVDLWQPVHLPFPLNGAPPTGMYAVPLHAPNNLPPLPAREWQDVPFEVHHLHAQTLATHGAEEVAVEAALDFASQDDDAHVTSLDTSLEVMAADMEPAMPPPVVTDATDAAEEVLAAGSVQWASATDAALGATVEPLPYVDASPADDRLGLCLGMAMGLPLGVAGSVRAPDTEAAARSTAVVTEAAPETQERAAPLGDWKHVHEPSAAPTVEAAAADDVSGTQPGIVKEAAPEPVAPLSLRLALGAAVGLPSGVPMPLVVDAVASGANRHTSTTVSGSTDHAAFAVASALGLPAGVVPQALRSHCTAAANAAACSLTLHELVGELRSYFEATGFHSDKAAKIRDLDAILAKFDFTTPEWQSYAVFERDQRYTRNLLATDDHYFSLSMLCWNTGVDSPIHSHPSDGCWMQVTRGTVSEKRFVPNEATGKLDLTEELVYKPGTTFFINDSQGYHQVSSVGGDACTLHLYSPPLRDTITWEDPDDLSSAVPCTIGHHHDHGVKACRLQRFDRMSGK